MSNTISYNNTTAHFEGSYLHEARELLSYRKDGYIFAPSYQRGNWDGMVRLMNRRGEFAAGLVPWLTDRISLDGVEVEVEDKRAIPPPPTPQLKELTSHVTLRPYQEEAVRRGMEAGRGVIHAPTGSGKTVGMCEIARRIARPCLVLTHRKDLLHQTRERFQQQLGDKDVVGIIGDGRFQPSLITIATFQTLYRKLSEARYWLREEINQVHVDECQHIPATSFSKVMGFSTAYWRFGYSATPTKEGDLETFFRVSSHLGPTIHHVTAEELVEQGHIVGADVFFLSPTWPAIPDEKDYQTAYQTGIVENEGRNQAIVSLAQALIPNGQTLILCERLAHGAALAKSLDCPFVEGATSSGERQILWQRFREGVEDILVVTKIGDEGLDLPGVAHLIFAGGGKAAHLSIQRIGRGMRVVPHKDRLFVFDLVGTGKYNGSQSRARLKTYQREPAYNVIQTTVEKIMEEMV